MSGRKKTNISHTHDITITIIPIIVITMTKQLKRLMYGLFTYCILKSSRLVQFGARYIVH